MPYIEFLKSGNKNIKCKICAKEIKSAYLQCDTCRNCYHPECKTKSTRGLTSSQIWYCSNDCRPVTFAKTPLEIDVDTITIATSSSSTAPTQVNHETTIAGVLMRLEAEFAEVKSIINDIRASQDFICNEFEVISSQFKNISTENAYLKQKVEALNISYQKQDERLHLMEAQLDFTLQKELVNNVVICNVPADVPDTSKFIVDTIINVNSEAKISEIKKMFHHPNSKSSLKNGYIITLNSVDIKADILSKLKRPIRKSDALPPFSSSKESAGCYAMHHLTKFQSKLYYEAKKLQRTDGFKYLWIKGGKIFLRKTSESLVNHIHSMNDIFRLATYTTSMSPQDDA